LQIKTKKFSSVIADSKPVKQEVNCIVILPPLVFPGLTNLLFGNSKFISPFSPFKKQRKGFTNSLFATVSFHEIQKFEKFRELPSRQSGVLRKKYFCK
jgi:hypothetical protein